MTSPPAPLPAIEASGLVKTYSDGIRALDGLTFAVPAGTVFGMLGPNGAGKSTAVKILTTLSKADAGQARVAGIDVARHPDRVRLAIGYVAQKSGTDREATGRENLLLQGRFFGLGGRALKGRVAEMLERFGLARAADRVASGYSGGMQRRLDIAMGLLHRPRVLFLDEPTTGLDPGARVQMWDEIARLRADEGLSILLTTHYMEEADRLAQHLAIVDRGRVVAEGTPEELKGALRGDAILMELAQPAAEGLARTVLESLQGVREVAVQGTSLRARVDSGPTAVPVVLAALEERQIKVASVTVARPSLDDVYLQYAGRTFRDAEAGAPPPATAPARGRGRPERER